MRGPSSRELRTFRKLTERDRENQTGQNRDLDVPHLFESRPSEAWHSRYAMSESNDARHTRNVSCVCTTTPGKLFFSRTAVSRQTLMGTWNLSFRNLTGQNESPRNTRPSGTQAALPNNSTANTRTRRPLHCRR